MRWAEIATKSMLKICFLKRFQCRNGLCMPPASDFNGIFNNAIFQNPQQQGNLTTAAPISG